MIGKISRGWRVGGLIRYLMGPGRFNEHVRPRVVASWDGFPHLWQPPAADGRFDCSELIAELAAPQIAAGLPQQEPAAGPNGKRQRGPVWHCSLRNHAEDRPLSDAEWAQIIVEVLDRTGIGPRDDPLACRWVAVRHADDHVHIAAVLVRQDTARRVHPEFDYPKVRRVCREVEKRLGLTVTSDADRTATRYPNRAEQEKGQRIARDDHDLERTMHGRPSRDVLRAAARRAAVQVQTPEGFLERLRARGLFVRPHHDRAGRIDGYAVALPGDVDAGGKPVWYSGGRLARDLSMPILRRVWASAPAPAEPIAGDPTERSRIGRAERAASLAEATTAARDATHAVREAAQDTNHGGSDEPPAQLADGVAHSLRDLLEVLDHAVARRRFPELQDVAARFDGAARTPHSVLPTTWSSEARALRTAAWRLVRVGTVTGIGQERVPLAALVAAVAALVVEIAAYRATQQRLAQVRRARDTVDQLAAAAEARLSHRPEETSRPADDQQTSTGRREDAQGQAAPSRGRPVPGPPATPRHPPVPRGRGR